MAIVSMHSFRGGTGKSNTTANLAVLAAQEGRRVGVVDLDMHSPGVHIVLGFDHAAATRTLNDFLEGRCEIIEAAYAVDAARGPGSVHLVPASMDAAAIARVVRNGYDVNRLADGVRRLIQELDLDLVILDTHPGLGEDTLLSIALSDVLVILLRPDQQDFEGTMVTVTVARRLQVPRMVLALNKLAPSHDPAALRASAETTYGCEVGAVMVHADEMLTHSSRGAFVQSYPDHPLAGEYRSLLQSVGQRV
ncbi:MAG TPA: MinD/ParA family protein [Baekduia sp.]|nr:MinD/ParA family protein [Baekduia sp.]